MNVSLHFKNFSIPAIYVKTILGIIQVLVVVIPFVLWLLLLVKYLSAKVNIKYYEKHPEQENASLRLQEEKESIDIVKMKIKKYIVISIVCILIAIGLEVIKRVVVFN